jgi:hypothetical protein
MNIKTKYIDLSNTIYIIYIKGRGREGRGRETRGGGILTTAATYIAGAG